MLNGSVKKKKSSKSSSKTPTPAQTTTEPWLTRTQKIVATVISVLVLSGMLWNYGAKADARYAKEVVVSKELSQVKTDIAMLGKAFQAEQLDRSISNKQDLLLKINLRLKEKISNAERAQLEDVKRNIEKELDKLKDKQKKLDDGT